MLYVFIKRFNSTAQNFYGYIKAPFVDMYEETCYQGKDSTKVFNMIETIRAISSTPLSRFWVLKVKALNADQYDNEEW